MDGRTDGREKKNTSKINWHSGLDYKLPSRLIPKLTWLKPFVFITGTVPL